jgi:hypothetical protein
MTLGELPIAVVGEVSVGFLPMVGGDRWNADRTRVERIQALAHHVGVVPLPTTTRASPPYGPPRGRQRHVCASLGRLQ